MKLSIRGILGRLIALAAVAAVAIPALRAETYVDPYKDYNEFVFFEYSLDRNVATPAVGKSEHRAIKEYMGRIKDQLKGKYTLDLCRDNEVLIVTIPSDDLFLPCDTLLTSYGVNRLKPLLPYMQDPMMFKVVFTVHTDDTGSEVYKEALADARTETIYAWMLENVPEELMVIPYAMQDEVNLVPNNTRDNRAINRRLELYLIPGPKLIQQAHEGKLK